jgi:hypothetical protein
MFAKMQAKLLYFCLAISLTLFVGCSNNPLEKNVIVYTDSSSKAIVDKTTKKSNDFQTWISDLKEFFNYD